MYQNLMMDDDECRSIGGMSSRGEENLSSATLSTTNPIWPGTIGQIMSDVPSGLSLTPTQELIKL
jgi:hypothetical protein